MNVQVESGNIVINIIVIALFLFLGINMIFRNEIFLNWFETTAKKTNKVYGKTTGHKFNKIMFYLLGVFSLFFACLILLITILSVL